MGGLIPLGVLGAVLPANAVSGLRLLRPTDAAESFIVGVFAAPDDVLVGHAGLSL
jgi:hypothetical protein